MNGLNREIVRASIGRLDETSEFIAYWLERFGRKIPSAVKRGIGDALNDLLNEGSYLKWSGRASRGSVSLGDVINLTHAKPKDEHQSALYQVVLDRQYGAEEDLSSLPVVKARQEFLSMPVDKQIRALSGKSADKVIRSARLIHEVVAGSIGKIPAKVWKNLISHMGYTALRMNLRRISESGVTLTLSTRSTRFCVTRRLLLVLRSCRLTSCVPTRMLHWTSMLHFKEEQMVSWRTFRH